MSLFDWWGPAASSTRIPKPLARLRTGGGVYFGEDRVMTSTAFGHRIFLDARDLSLSPVILDTGQWQNRTTGTLLHLVRPGQTVLEVGANVGFFTLLMADRVGKAGRVHAFEANPRIHEMLWQSVELNRFRDRVTTVPMAAYRSTGTVTFSQYDRYSGGSHVGTTDAEAYRKDFSDTVTTIDVPAITLDDYVARHGLTPDLIRIDAEGAEAAIFEGMAGILAGSRPLTIVAEFCALMIESAGDDPAAFLADVRGRGFTVRACGVRGPQPVDTDRLLADRESVTDLVFTRR